MASRVRMNASIGFARVSWPVCGTVETLVGGTNAQCLDLSVSPERASGHLAPPTIQSRSVCTCFTVSRLSPGGMTCSASVTRHPADEASLLPASPGDDRRLAPTRRP